MSLNHILYLSIDGQIPNSFYSVTIMHMNVRSKNTIEHTYLQCHITNSMIQTALSGELPLIYYTYFCLWIISTRLINGITKFFIIIIQHYTGIILYPPSIGLIYLNKVSYCNVLNMFHPHIKTLHLSNVMHDVYARSTKSAKHINIAPLIYISNPENCHILL